MLTWRGDDLSMRDVWASIAADLEGAASAPGQEIARPEIAALAWQPLSPQQGRGILLPDGRLLSPQQLAVETPADELFFGGGLGGGKSFLLLGLAMTRHRNSIIFRPEYPQFGGAEGLIEKSKEIAGLAYADRYNHSAHLWRGLPGDRWLEFGAVANEKRRKTYAGRPHDLKGFDELPQIKESLYRFLIGWLRTAHEGQRCRVIGTGNPPMTEDERWVIPYWGPWLDPQHPRPALPGELRWYIVDAEGTDREVPGPAWGWERPPAQHVGGDAACAHEYEGPQWTCTRCGGREVAPRSRTFIPSSVEDNPHYMRTGYAAVIDSMPEPMRSALRFGNFQAAAGDHPWQVIPTAWVLAAQARWKPDGHGGRPLDQAGVDPSRGGEAEFVVAPRHGAWVGPLAIHTAKEAPDGLAGAQLIVRDLSRLNGTGNPKAPVAIDVIGTAGGSVYDHAAELRLRAVPMNANERSYARDKSGALGFANKRAEWHWRLREALDPTSGQDVALPPDAQLRADLCAPRWAPGLRGVQVEPKDAIQQRLGRSPDRGEAVIYACAPDVLAVDLELITGPRPKTDAEQAQQAATRRAKAEQDVLDAIAKGGAYWPGDRR